MSTPAANGLSRAHASMPRASSATAYRSQLIVAVRASTGAVATMAASHRRRPASAAVAATATAAASAAPSALMSKYQRDRSLGVPPAGTSFAVRYITAPVSTGYSTCRSGVWPMYGTSPSARPRPKYSGGTSL